jgi:Fe-S-cluster containining protein
MSASNAQQSEEHSGGDAAAWLRAARQPEVVAALESVYAYIAAQVESRRPVCEQSGRCCRFEEHGHRLYVTGLEAACTLAQLGRTLGRDELALAKARGGCPFQIDNLCSVHAIRPLGCRVYYCDPTAQQWQEELSERALAEVRRIHERYVIPYRYGEWRAILGAIVEAAEGGH